MRKNAPLLLWMIACGSSTAVAPVTEVPPHEAQEVEESPILEPAEPAEPAEPSHSSDAPEIPPELTASLQRGAMVARVRQSESGMTEVDGSVHSWVVFEIVEWLHGEPNDVLEPYRTCFPVHMVTSVRHRQIALDPSATREALGLADNSEAIMFFVPPHPRAAGETFLLPEVPAPLAVRFGAHLVDVHAVVEAAQEATVRRAVQALEEPPTSEE